VNEVLVKAHERRFKKVFSYIDEHLNEPMSVDVLSRVANFSKFHFHRQFLGLTGVSVIAYIRMARLKRASYQMVFHKHVRVIDIAMDACFENPESFSRAFKQAFNQTPSQFRRKPKWTPWKDQFRFPEGTWRESMDVKIVEFVEIKIAKIEHRGAPERVNNTALKFIEWRKTSGLSPVNSSQTYGIAYDDPETTEPDNFRFDICGSVIKDISEDNTQGVVNGIIPAGRCAVVRHLGSHDRLGESAYYLYRDWLPGSGEELRDFPMLFHYLNLFPEVAEHELETDVYLPLS